MAISTPGPALYLTEIKVTDWPAMVRWYVATLGMRLTREDEPHQYALLESDSGGGRVAIKAGRPPGMPPGPVRLVFETAALESLRTQLAAAGEDVSPPEESSEG